MNVTVGFEATGNPASRSAASSGMRRFASARPVPAPDLAEGVFKRLDEVRRFLGCDHEQFAEMMGAVVDTDRDGGAERSVPNTSLSIEHVIYLHTEFGVNPDWLLLGKGDSGLRRDSGIFISKSPISSRAKSVLLHLGAYTADDAMRLLRSMPHNEILAAPGCGKITLSELVAVFGDR